MIIRTKKERDEETFKNNSFFLSSLKDKIFSFNFIV